MHRLPLASLLAGILVSGAYLPDRARAEEVLDQEQAAGANFGHQPLSSPRTAQTFRAGRTGRLTRVALDLRRAASFVGAPTTDIVVAIRATALLDTNLTDGHGVYAIGPRQVPTGPDLASVVILNADLPESAIPAFVDAPLGSGVEITAGTTYAIEVRPLAGGRAPGWGLHEDVHVDGYPEGGFFLSFDGPTWTEGSRTFNPSSQFPPDFRDLQFRTYVEVPDFFAISGAGRFYRSTPTGWSFVGEVTPLSPGASYTNLATGPSGELLTLQTTAPHDLLEIDPATGQGTVVGRVDVEGIRAMAMTPEGVLYGVDAPGVGGARLHRFDPAAGVSVVVGPLGQTSVFGLEVTPQGDMYAWANGDGVGLVTIDPATGLADEVVPGAAVAPALITSLASSDTGALYGLGLSGDLFSIFGDALTPIMPGGGGAGADPFVGLAVLRAPTQAPPSARNDTYATAEDTLLSVSAPGVLDNDTDVNEDALSAMLVSAPVHGALALGSEGSFTYAPAANFHGTDSFAYVAVDAGGLESGPATVVITVSPVNDAPVASSNAYSTDEDTPLSIAAPGVLGNDSDVDGDALSALVVTGPSHGALTLQPDGSFLYVPALNYNGTDSFTYRARDAGGLSSVAAVTLTIIPVNDAPVAAADAYATNEDTALSIAAPGVLGNDSDVDGDALSALLVSEPDHGTLTFANGSFLYTPAPDYAGPDAFTYVAFDGELSSDEATVALSVIAVNDAPVNQVPGTQRLLLGILGSVTFSNANGNAIRATDIDAGSAPVRVTLQASNGRLTLGRTAGLTFTAGDGTDDATMTFTGSLAAVNAALEGLRFQPTLLPFTLAGRGSVTITTGDNGNTGLGGPLSDTDVIVIDRLIL